MTAAGSVGCDKRLWSPEELALGYWLLAFSSKPASLRDGAGESPAPTRVPLLPLPLGLAASQFLDFGLFRSAGVVAGLERLFGFAFFTRCAFGFLAFFFG